MSTLAWHPVIGHRPSGWLGLLHPDRNPYPSWLAIEQPSVNEGPLIDRQYTHITPKKQGFFYAATWRHIDRRQIGRASDRFGSLPGPPPRAARSGSG